MKKFLSGVCFTLIIIAAVMVAKTVIPAHADESAHADAEATETIETENETTETTETTAPSSKKSGGKRSSTTTTAPSYDEVEPTYFDEPDEGASESQAPSTDEVVAEAQEDDYAAPVGEMSWVWLQEADGMAYLQNRPFTDGSGRHLTYAEATELCGGVSQAEFWQLSEDLLIETHTYVVFSQRAKGKFVSLRQVYDPDTGVVTNF